MSNRATIFVEIRVSDRSGTIAESTSLATFADLKAASESIGSVAYQSYTEVERRLEQLVAAEAPAEPAGDPADEAA